MGKSLKNVVSPDEIYDAYGADTLRLHLMATGPLDASRPWETPDVVGMYRFLQRLWRNLVDEDTGEVRVGRRRAGRRDACASCTARSTVRTDIEALRFNTAIAKLIELNNHLTKLGAAPPRARRAAGADVLAPFAPHLGEELWQRLGHDGRSPTSRSPRPTRRCSSTTPSSTRCRSTASCAAVTVPPTPTGDVERRPWPTTPPPHPTEATVPDSYPLTLNAPRLAQPDSNRDPVVAWTTAPSNCAAVAEVDGARALRSPSHGGRTIRRHIADERWRLSKGEVGVLAVLVPRAPDRRRGAGGGPSG